MKRTALLVSLFLLCAPAFGHAVIRHFDYTIVFGGCFNQDIVSLKINNTVVFDRYEVDNASAERRGNLSLTQTDEGIKIYYNGGDKTMRKVPVDHHMDVEVTINKEVSRFQVDLRKGKVVLLDHCSGAPALTARPVSVEQLHEPVIFM